jgi:hypothetical protein
MSCQDELVDGLCIQCGFSHRACNRRRHVLRMLPATFDDIREAWPCFYERGHTGNKRLQRDLRALGAAFGRSGIYRGMWRVQG